MTSNSEASNVDAPTPTLKKPGFLESMSLAGTTAIIVVNFTHPIEVVKTRMQVVANYSIGGMLKSEGYMSLYKGIQVDTFLPTWDIQHVIRQILFISIHNP